MADFAFPNFNVPFPYLNLPQQLQASMQTPPNQTYGRFGQAPNMGTNLPNSGMLPQLPPQVGIPQDMLLGGGPAPNPGTNPGTNPGGLLGGSPPTNAQLLSMPQSALWALAHTPQPNLAAGIDVNQLSDADKRYLGYVSAGAAGSNFGNSGFITGDQNAINQAINYNHATMQENYGSGAGRYDGSSYDGPLRAAAEAYMAQQMAQNNARVLALGPERGGIGYQMLTNPLAQRLQAAASANPVPTYQSMGYTPRR